MPLLPTVPAPRKPFPTKTPRGMVDERAALADLSALATSMHEDAFNYFEFPTHTVDDLEVSVIVASSYHRKMKRLKDLVAGLHLDETCLPAKPRNR